MQFCLIDRCIDELFSHNFCSTVDACVEVLVVEVLQLHKPFKKPFKRVKA